MCIREAPSAALWPGWAPALLTLASIRLDPPSDGGMLAIR